MPDKIGLDELYTMIADPKTDEALLSKYVLGDPTTSHPFAPGLRIDPDLVELGEEHAFEARAGLVMNSFNRLSRLRRRNLFLSRLQANEPVVLAEGDSWFQFPLLLKDVVDHLTKSFNVDCASAAGDTLQNMVIDAPEYIKLMTRNHGVEPKGFIFSGAGNDIIGEDPDGIAVIQKLVKIFHKDRKVDDYIQTDGFRERLKFIEDCYDKVATEARKLLPSQAPIIFHSYAYALPGGHPGDPRNPKYASQTQWLGRPFGNLGIADETLQRGIVKAMIDRLHATLKDVAKRHKNVVVVDVRKDVGTDKAKWNDEIHPTSDSFAAVAKKFAEVIP